MPLFTVGKKCFPGVSPESAPSLIFFIRCNPSIEESCETTLHDTAIITLPSLSFPLHHHYFLTDTYKALKHCRKRWSWRLLRSQLAFVSLVFIWAAHSLQYFYGLAETSLLILLPWRMQKAWTSFLNIPFKGIKKLSILNIFEPREELRMRDRWLDHLQGFSEVCFVRVMIEASLM